MIPTSDDELLHEVMRRGALASEDDAARVVRATLAVLGERLTLDEAQAVAGALPGALARVVTESGYDGDFDAAELVERVRRREGGSPGFAREHVHVVLAAIARHLDDGARRRVARALPAGLAELFAAPTDHGDVPPYASPSHGPPVRSLATGKPGSAHPLSESAPPSGQAHSVARNPDPHADTKLASARGTTQERLGETLARGRPPAPERPVAEAHDEEGGVS